APGEPWAHFLWVLLLDRDLPQVEELPGRRADKALHVGLHGPHFGRPGERHPWRVLFGKLPRDFLDKCRPLGLVALLADHCDPIVELLVAEAGADLLGFKAAALKVVAVVAADKAATSKAGGEHHEVETALV